MTNDNTLTIEQLIERLNEIASSRGLGAQIDTGIGEIHTDGVRLSFDCASEQALKDEIEDLEDEVSTLKAKVDDLKDELAAA